jgi:hypothetical protein
VFGSDSSAQAAGVQVSTPTFPQYLFNATTGASNAKIWRMIGRGNNNFEIQTLNDSYTGEVTAMQINRSGTSISNVDFPNGNVGIGTTSPGARLDVFGSDSSAQAAGVQVSTPTFPQYLFNATTGASNAKVWRIIGRGTNDFEIQTLNDSYSGEVTAMQINRSGTSITNVDFPNGTVSIGAGASGGQLSVGGPNARGVFVDVTTPPFGVLPTGLTVRGGGSAAIAADNNSFFNTLSLTQAGSGFLIAGFNGGGSRIFSVDNVGNVAANGCVFAVNTNPCVSDIRLKKNIQPFPPGVLDKLVRLQPVSYNWRAEEYPLRRFGTSRTFGLIAQEVEKVFPEMVSEDEAGYKGVNYVELPLLMLQAIRELKAEKDEMKAENDDLRKRLQRLEEAANH